ncbi:DNA-3-methyladenine glycosylase [Candidatus Babeliales bacterium]|nr:DNA-3-methyladenine glycosylase [Candidatus Babeliales bacterium]
MNKILTVDFFNRPTLKVAKDILGKYLIKKLEDKKISLIITEVEAYDGENDLACHGRLGKTKRTEPMFGNPGYFYVYLIYGMYWMLNIVTGSKNYPAAILIRGTNEISGPGRLTKKLNIDKKFNKKIANPKTGLWFEDRGVKITQKNILRTPRIGVKYAGPIWGKKPYRFVLKSL